MLELDAALERFIPKPAAQLPRVEFQFVESIAFCPSCGYSQPARDLPSRSPKAAAPKPAGNSTVDKPKPKSNIVELDRNRARDIHSGEHAALKVDATRDPNLGGFTAHRRDEALPLPQPEPSR
jgi:hypothetical protein